MLHITKRSRSPLPKLVGWNKIFLSVFPAPYDLSVVIGDDKLSERLNARYRAKNKPTNVLAFPLEQGLGEIFLNWAKIKREATTLKETAALRLTYLFIHGLLHLKGYRHGSKMESKEQWIMNTTGYGKKINRRT